MPYTALQLSVRPLPDKQDIPALQTGVYTFSEENALGIRHLQLFEDHLAYENARGAVRLPFRRGQVMETAYPGWPGVPALVAAGWLAKGLLRIRCHAVGTAPCGFDMLISFAGSRVTVQCRRSGDPVTAGYDGAASGIETEETQAQ